MRRTALLIGCLIAVPASVTSQGRPELQLERADGSTTSVSIEMDRGFAAVPVTLFEALGWTVTALPGRSRIAIPGEIEILLEVGSAFFHWDGVALQLADAPYTSGASVLVPVQLLTDFLPRRLPDLYDFDGPRATLRAGDPAARGSPTRAAPPPSAPAPAPSEPESVREDVPVGVESAEPEAVTTGPSLYDGVRVVVIDAGHGGADPGALGPDGIREKAVALGIATRLARILEAQSQFEVRMTRDDDTFVDIWQRGELATEWRGDRPGIFVSIHANSFPARRAATGFETYFLSEARTEHERRVAAIENAPLRISGQDVDPEREADLDFILRELTNLDHQHWSALLAEFVQDELDDFHPGPNRGVKQGVLAVLTNALMPSVLVEVGYLSNADEGRLIGEAAFHDDAADAIADAVVRFFERYPPGNGFGGREGG